MCWLAVAGAVGLGLASSLSGERRELFLPGTTTDGHYQFQEQCDLCHTPLAGVKQDACLQCHDDELEAADDSHPPAKFLDPRNAGRVERLDARRCVACHVEHQPSRADRHGATQPRDYCRACHADVAVERPSHAGMSFETCRNTGCHNFHDNRALTQEHLAAHLDEPALSSNPVVPRLTAERGVPLRALGRDDADAPLTAQVESAVADWAASAHAAAGVNCSHCHGEASAWVDAVDRQVCEDCHGAQADSFRGGRHGMRLAVGLPAMTPGQARLPMRRDAAEHALSCTSCHGAHAFDRARAAVDACLECHDDEHSRAYVRSPHYVAWTAERAGIAASGTGVSCATCHLPQIAGATEHNQSAMMRPGDKMVRPVCMHCHGLSLSLDSLADPALVRDNFPAAPARHLRTFDMVRDKLRSKR